MNKLEWNALRLGDSVLVHDPRDSTMRLVPATVALVDTRRSANDIGLRVASVNERSSVVRPNRLAVHLDPLEGTEDCWRCDAIVTQTAKGHRL